MRSTASCFSARTMMASTYSFRFLMPSSRVSLLVNPPPSML